MPISDLEKARQLTRERRIRGMSVTPEMEFAIQNIQQRFGKQRREADARGIGEATRRGLVSPTGTSSIEAGLRQARTQPLVESEQNIISNLIRGGADQRREERLIGEGRQYQTGEREAGQRYGTRERVGRQQFQGNERVGSQIFSGNQSALDRGLSLTLQDRGFRHNIGMAQLNANLNKPKKRKWYDGVVQGIAGGAGQGIGTGLGYKWGGLGK